MIYYYGGITTLSTDLPTSVSSFLMLDTETWKWMMPAQIDQVETKPIKQYGISAGVLYEKYLLVAFGQTAFEWSTAIDVLQLPDSSNCTENFKWISKITTISGEGVNGASTSIIKDAGDIVGISIGCTIFLILILLIWRYCWYDGVIVNKIRAIGNDFCIWNPRMGEPLWTEYSHLVAKCLLFGVFISYVIYSIMLVLNSSVSPLTITTPVDQVLFPDIRFCIDDDPQSSSYIACQSDTLTFDDCFNLGFLERANMSKHYPFFVDSTTEQTSYWLFTPSEEFRVSKKLHSSVGRIKFIIYLAEHEENIDISNQTTLGSHQVKKNINVELLPHGKNPNLIVFKDIDQPSLSPQELYTWINNDWSDLQSENKYTITYPSISSISYQHQTHRYITDNGWNNIGFAQIYNDSLQLTTSLHTTNQMIRDDLYTFIDIYPAENMVDIILQDKKMYTFVTVIGFIGGLLSLLVALDSILFGFRPRSP
ncbi:hypothetical protein BDA99DRAFT_517763 [Phascolomyces articulosus]|uniref:Uncharacterized protein n=1 Tax=Phascolomyces articulosus TaxID=60185 RepID=A0AAD5JUC8_9FUNG|nr:hypothetical protein BDA99DRAFT_517763 [Phascolomyces articulosus]